MGGWWAVNHRTHHCSLRLTGNCLSFCLVLFAVLFFLLVWPFGGGYSLEQFLFGHFERPVAFGSGVPIIL